jgi:hypothetical protein
MPRDEALASCPGEVRKYEQIWIAINDKRVWMAGTCPRTIPRLLARGVYMLFSSVASLEDRDGAFASQRFRLGSGHNVG